MENRLNGLEIYDAWLSNTTVKSVWASAVINRIREMQAVMIISLSINHGYKRGDTPRLMATIQDTSGNRISELCICYSEIIPSDAMLQQAYDALFFASRAFDIGREFQANELKRVLNYTA